MVLELVVSPRGRSKILVYVPRATLTSRTDMRVYAANAILVIHFAVVLFITAAVPLIYMGAALRWSWVRNRLLRIVHLGAIAFVAGESIVGIMCPLTVWENELRGRQSDIGFIEAYLHRMMFYPLPRWVFTAAYVAFAILVIVTWIVVPPRNAYPRTHRLFNNGRARDI